MTRRYPQARNSPNDAVPSACHAVQRRSLLRQKLRVVDSRCAACACELGSCFMRGQRHLKRRGRVVCCQWYVGHQPRVLHWQW